MVSKLNSDRKPGEGAGQAISRIYGKIGFTGLWNGLPVRIFMIGTLTAFQWLIYDSFKVYLGVRIPDTSAPRCTCITVANTTCSCPRLEDTEESPLLEALQLRRSYSSVNTATIAFLAEERKRVQWFNATLFTSINTRFFLFDFSKTRNRSPTNNDNRHLTHGKPSHKHNPQCRFPIASRGLAV